LGQRVAPSDVRTMRACGGEYAGAGRLGLNRRSVWAVVVRAHTRIDTEKPIKLIVCIKQKGDFAQWQDFSLRFRMKLKG
jgi:hypothetical protein